ncbi:MAG: dihydroorotate dehydrogenase [Dehalococcoidia bacterium]
MTRSKLSVQLVKNRGRDLTLSNPVIAASGTFGYGTEYADVIDIQRLGAIICKGTTLEPREGNPSPRLVETASGLLNSIGLENIGVEAVIREKARMWSQWQVPVVVNVAGETVDEYTQMASALDGVEGVAGLEVNISCPNLTEGGIDFGTSSKGTSQVISSMRKETNLPLIAKLTPNVTDITETARAAADAGADCITVANTFKGMAIDTAGRHPVLGNTVGGLSGPAIKPQALYLVFTVAGAVDVPVIGCGGITTARDALEFIMAGASAIEVGTATFNDPGTMLKIVDGIYEFLEKERVSGITELIGAANL